MWAEPKRAKPCCRNAASASGEAGGFAGSAATSVLNAAELVGVAAPAAELLGAEPGVPLSQADVAPTRVSTSRKGARSRTREPYRLPVARPANASPVFADSPVACEHQPRTLGRVGRDAQWA